MAKLTLSVFASVLLIQVINGEECGKPADVAFIIDSSSSIWEPNFFKQLDFVKKLVQMFDIGPETTQVAAITFADKIGYEFFFSDFKTEAEVLAKVGNITHAAGRQTWTHDALKIMRTEIYSPQHGARSGVPKICILLTDGVSTFPNMTLIEASLAKAAGIKIIAIGIGNKVKTSELEQVVTPPAAENFFHVQTYTELNTASFQQLVGQQACEVIETTTALPTTTTEATTTTTTTEATTTTIEITTTPEPFISTTEMKDATITCQGKEADIVLVIDMSTSIYIEDFKRQLMFLTDLVSHFDIDSGKTRVAMILFSDNAKVEFYLNQYTKAVDVAQAIASVKFEGGVTNTHLALELMMNDVLTKEHGSRSNVAHICIIITDGRSREVDKTHAEIEKIHASGVYVFAVGVGNRTDATELKEMATDSSYAFEVKKGYQALGKIKNLLAYKTCDVPQGDQPRCAENIHADIVFGLLNIGGGARDSVTEFIKKVGGGFELSTGRVRIGLVENCGRAELQLQEFESAAMYGSSVSEVMTTDISSLLYRIRTSFLPSQFDQIDSASIIILLVSGKIHDVEKASIEAMRLKYKARIIVIGVDSSVDVNQLKQLASYKDSNMPDMSHVFQLKESAQLLEKIKAVYMLLCQDQ